VSARWGIEPGRVEAVRQRERARFAREHPRCLAALARAGRSMPGGVPMSWMATSFGHEPVVAAEGSGAWFTCLDRVRFLDTNIGDKSTFCGLDRAGGARVGERAAKGWQFLLPTEEAGDVAEELSGAGACRCGSSRSRPPRPTSSRQAGTARDRTRQAADVRGQLRRA